MIIPVLWANETKRSPTLRKRRWTEVGTTRRRLPISKLTQHDRRCYLIWRCAWPVEQRLGLIDQPVLFGRKWQGSWLFQKEEFSEFVVCFKNTYRLWSRWRFLRLLCETRYRAWRYLWLIDRTFHVLRSILETQVETRWVPRRSLLEDIEAQRRSARLRDRLDQWLKDWVHSSQKNWWQL